MEPFRFEGDRVWLLDQTALPGREEWVSVTGAAEMRDAIAALRVRGAPALGIAAALALALEAARAEGSHASRMATLEDAGRLLVGARPTAVNLSAAVARLLSAAAALPEEPARAWSRRVRDEALALWEDDRAASRAMARHGAALFPRERRFLTHCHTGGLATGGGGTALGVLLELRRGGRAVEVIATETRPLLQGARLTAWELVREGVPVTLVADGAAPGLIARGRVEAVIVGADRIARNGDVANKVGTYPLALAAREARIPFVVVAPWTTVDVETRTGEGIPIEERDPSEVLAIQGLRLAAEGAGAANPAFDVTPAALVTCIVTERGTVPGPRYLFEPVDFPSRSG